MRPTNQRWSKLVLPWSEQACGGTAACCNKQNTSTFFRACSALVSTKKALARVMAAADTTAEHSCLGPLQSIAFTFTQHVIVYLLSKILLPRDGPQGGCGLEQVSIPLLHCTWRGNCIQLLDLCVEITACFFLNKRNTPTPMLYKMSNLTFLYPPISYNFLKPPFFLLIPSDYS